ncbi:triacylglycerol lipase [Thioalkalivibrio sp. ALJ7]|uniref:esterase/lipase family protein n=1 Tax=Thioalkalivibrio sp. ALJ7 TaxID=1158756 RepID=UPI00036EED8F|nr:alpha/beta fold hydrolase [Thioalkalivibrio sp. ALJ7]
MTPWFPVRCAGLWRLLLLVLGLWLLPGLVAAQVVVLVPGGWDRGDSFRHAGFTAALNAAGYADGGRIRVVPEAPWFDRAVDPAPRQFYTVDLPSSAALPEQSRALGQMVERLVRRHPDRELILVGHSTGGVVARDWLVRRPHPAVSTLVTFSAPHAGAGWSALARSVADALADSALGLYAPFAGLQGLHRRDGLWGPDRASPDAAYLEWLNTREHPPIRYVSVVRLADPWVDAASQDMNRLPALRGRAHTLPSPGGHRLEAADGTLLAALLLPR